MGSPRSVAEAEAGPALGAGTAAAGWQRGPSPRTHLSAGVHRKTKVYMEPSNSDCIAPSSAILGSAGGLAGRIGAARGCVCGCVCWDWMHAARSANAWRQPQAAGPATPLPAICNCPAPPSAAGSTRPLAPPPTHRHRTVPDERSRLLEAIHRGAVLRGVAIVFRPRGEDDEAADCQHGGGGVKGRHGTPGSRLHQRVCHQACTESVGLGVGVEERRGWPGLGCAGGAGILSS